MSNNCGILHIHINISAILVGRDYPHPEGIEHVRRKWKEAIRNPNNYPGFVHIISAPAHNAVAADVPGVVEKDRLGRAAILPTAPEELEEIEQENERILRKAVGRGRYVSWFAASRYGILILFSFHSRINKNTHKLLHQILFSSIHTQGHSRNGGDNPTQKISDHASTVWWGSRYGWWDSSDCQIDWRYHPIIEIVTIITKGGTKYSRISMGEYWWRRESTWWNYFRMTTNDDNVVMKHWISARCKWSPTSQNTE